MLPYAITIFLSAFLLFLVQPLIAKYILPWFGGGPGVWTTCLLFFQALLLVGYAYAHATVKWLKPRGQAVVHLILVAAALAFLPIVPGESWRTLEQGDPSWRILALLAACIGAPYLALSATGPLMQAWFARTNPGRSPYRLYALSNLGSLLALLGYPFVIEPRFTRVLQAVGWSWGFAIFALAALVCAIDLWRRAKPVELLPSSPIEPSNQTESSEAPAHPQPTPGLVALWILLPACASVLLMSFTTRMTEEIAPVPLLWIVPLAVYLLSFIVCFEWPRLYHRPTYIGLLLFSYWLVTIMMLWQQKFGFGWLLLGWMFTLFVCCMICHGESYRLRPAPSRLTAFYLAIAAGGALGGAFVALVAPRIFNFQAEFYIALFGALVLLLVCAVLDRQSVFYAAQARAGWLGLILIALTAGCGIAYMAAQNQRYTILRTRNFFGTLRVDERPGPPDRGNALFLVHGRITHGAQFIDPQLSGWPTTYYGPETGCGRAIRHFPKTENRRIGVIGLGAGTIATYGYPDDVIRFYEINPAVVDIAHDTFGFLAMSPAKVEVVLGDARMSMEREDPQNYDILVLDAFTGDAIPLHLLTIEAFKIYDRHLKPDGVIVAHISNKYLQLHKPLLTIADQLNMEVAVVDNLGSVENLQNPSKWLIMTRNLELLNHDQIRPVADRPTPQTRRVALWTDDRVDLLEILKWSRSK